MSKFWQCFHSCLNINNGITEMTGARQRLGAPPGRAGSGPAPWAQQRVSDPASSTGQDVPGCLDHLYHWFPCYFEAFSISEASLILIPLADWFWRSRQLYINLYISRLSIIQQKLHIFILFLMWVLSVKIGYIYKIVFLGFWIIPISKKPKIKTKNLTTRNINIVFIHFFPSMKKASCH